MKRVAFFDSGIGGFTVLSPFVKEAQSRGQTYNITYLGDLANLPYGTKSPEQVRSLTEDAMQIMQHVLHDAVNDEFLVLIACNTASALALDVAKKSFARFPNVDVHGVIEAGCELAKVQAEESAGRIVILGTHATVTTHIHKTTLERLGFQGQVLEKACPLFVPLVEERLFSGPIAELGVGHYLDALLQAKDHVILGCTHYPFLRKCLETRYPNTTFIDPGEALAKKLFAQIPATPAATAGLSSWNLRSLFTDDTMTRERLASLLESLQLAQLKTEPELVFPPSPE